MTGPNETRVTLKPCPNPWCQGEAYLQDDLLRIDAIGTGWDAAVICLECGNSTPTHSTAAEAIAAWNNRAAQSDLLAALREARDALAGMVPDNVCLARIDFPDDALVPLDTTMGEMRAVMNALATITATLAEHGE